MKVRYIIGILLLITTSCSDFLEEYSQDTAYVRGYEDLDQLLLGDGYMEVVASSQLGDERVNSFYYPYIHFMSDETQECIWATLDYGRTSREAIFGYYTWQRRVGMNVEGTARNAEDRDWDRLYKHINIANMVIKAIDKEGADSDAGRQAIQRIKGEAHFLRAAYYFTLVNLYGKPYSKSTASSDPGVPLKLTDYVEDVKFNQRNSVESVYRQVIADLEIAETCLEGIPTKSIYRADISATNLLQSRVYLYMQDYRNAKIYAQKVIDRKSDLVNLNTFNSTDNYFLSSKSVETIFSMGSNVIPNTVTGYTRDFIISEELYKEFEPYKENEDLRQTVFLERKGGNYISRKVKPGRTDRIDVSDNFLFRTSEAYLNFAEAAACEGDEATALTALNTLREKRMKREGYVKIALSGNELITFIRNERFRELCFEGHRWFDLRRYTVNEKLPYTKTIRHTFTYFEEDWDGTVPIRSTVYELKENDSAYTLPIPTEVVEFDGVKDNPREDRTVVEVINY